MDLSKTRRSLFIQGLTGSGDPGQNDHGLWHPERAYSFAIDGERVSARGCDFSLIVSKSSKTSVFSIACGKGCKTPTPVSSSIHSKQKL
jgi:hypothetical protein